MSLAHNQLTVWHQKILKELLLTCSIFPNSRTSRLAVSPTYATASPTPQPSPPAFVEKFLSIHCHNAVNCCKNPQATALQQTICSRKYQKNLKTGACSVPVSSPTEHLVTLTWHCQFFLMQVVLLQISSSCQCFCCWQIASCLQSGTWRSKYLCKPRNHVLYREKKQQDCFMRTTI